MSCTYNNCSSDCGNCGSTCYTWEDRCGDSYNTRMYSDPDLHLTCKKIGEKYLSFDGMYNDDTLDLQSVEDLNLYTEHATFFATVNPNGFNPTTAAIHGFDKTGCSSELLYLYAIAKGLYPTSTVSRDTYIVDYVGNWTIRVNQRVTFSVDGQEVGFLTSTAVMKVIACGHYGARIITEMSYLTLPIPADSEEKEEGTVEVGAN